MFNSHCQSFYLFFPKVFLHWLKLVFQQRTGEEPMSNVLLAYLHVQMFVALHLKLPWVVAYLILDLHFLFLTIFSYCPASRTVYFCRDIWDHFVTFPFVNNLIFMPGCSEILSLSLYYNHFTRMCLVVNHTDRHMMDPVVCRFRELFLNCVLKYLFFWIVSVLFFSISNYAYFAFALITFHNHFSSRPLKHFLYFLCIFSLYYFCPLSP